jgi:hypothetical protein
VAVAIDSATGHADVAVAPPTEATSVGLDEHTKPDKSALSESEPVSEVVGDHIVDESLKLVLNARVEVPYRNRRSACATPLRRTRVAVARRCSAGPRQSPPISLLMAGGRRPLSGHLVSRR